MAPAVAGGALSRGAGPDCSAFVVFVVFVAKKAALLSLG